MTPIAFRHARFAGALLATLSLPILVAPPLAAQQGTATEDSLRGTLAAGRLGELFPASTYAVIESAGVDAHTAAADADALGEIVKDVVTALIESEGFIEEIERDIMREMRPFTPQPLHTILRQPGALALGRFIFFDREFIPSFVYAIDVKENGDAVRAALTELEQTVFGRRREMFKRETVQFHDHSMRQITTNRGPEEILVLDVGDAILLSNARPFLAECVARRSGEVPSYSGYTKGIDPNWPMRRLLSVHADLERFYGAIEAIMPWEVATIIDELGVESLTDLRAAISPAGEEGFRAVARLGMTTEAKGLLRRVLPGGVDLTLADYADDDTVLFAAGSFDSKELQEGLAKIVANLPSFMTRDLDYFLRDLDRGLEPIGMTRDDLVALMHSLGNKYSMAVSVQPGPIPIPQMIFMGNVRDGAALDALLTKVQKASGIEWKTDPQGIHYASVKAGQVRVNPCFIRDGETLMIGSQVQALRKAMKRKESGSGALAQREDFTAQVAKVKKPNLTAMSWIDASTLIELFYGMSLPMIRSEVSNEFPDVADAFPDADELAEAAGHLLHTLHFDDAGMHYESLGHATNEALLVMAVANFARFVPEMHGESLDEKDLPNEPEDAPARAADRDKRNR